MAIELWWGSGSDVSWRVLLGLEYKGLPYESNLIQPFYEKTAPPHWR